VGVIAGAIILGEYIEVVAFFTPRMNDILEQEVIRETKEETGHIFTKGIVKLFSTIGCDCGKSFV
jgi:hypothetical protein